MYKKNSETDKKEFLRLINQAHQASERSYVEVASLCNVSASYIPRILSGFRHPRRDVIILLCWLSWDQDPYCTDEILIKGGYKPLLNLKEF